MTLNITVLSDQAIYQSSDFLLWNRDAKEPLPFPSAKAVEVSNVAWRAAVTYAGLGRWDDIDTSELIARWLAAEVCESFHDLVECIRSRGSEWISDANLRSARPWRHTFVVAGYVDDRPTAAVVSNFEEIGHAPSQMVSAGMRVSYAVADDKPIVIVTGCIKPAVSRPQRRALARLVKDHGDDSGRIRAAMQAMNRAAAASGACPISEDCFVHSFDRFGAGFGSGAVVGAAPREIVDGVDMHESIKEIAAHFFPDGYRLAGSSFGTSAGAEEASRPTCAPSLSRFGRTTAELTLIELAADLGGRAVARATNGVITVGHGSHTPSGPDMPLLWNGPEPGRLPDLGGITGSATAINGHGLAVGWVEDPTRLSVAVSWDTSRTLHRLPVDRGSHSAATVVSSSGDIAGWVSIDPSESGQRYQRPVIWRSDGTQEVLDALLPTDWGYVVGMNGSGQVLVSGHRGAVGMPILWDSNGVLPLVSNEANVRSVGILDSGAVVGWSRDRNQDPVGWLWSPASGWSHIGTEPGWEITAASASGYVGGRVELEGWSRPWIMRLGDRPKILPHYAYHHHHVSDITDDGTAAGSASADHGYHALTWQAE